MKSICHTHRHSEYSLLDGCGTAKQYAERALELGQTSLTVSDHGTLAGTLHHYKACNEVGIKPILGMESYFKPNRHLKNNDHKEYNHLVLIAQNLEGWKNLMRISSESYKTGFYYKPCLDYELLEKYSEGLICTTACVSGYHNRNILRGDDNSVAEYLGFLIETFKDNLYMELMPHDFDNQRLLNIENIGLANRLGIPLLGTIDAHFPYEQWSATQDILIMVATGQSFEKRKIKKEDSGEDTYLQGCPTAYLMSREEAESTFNKYHPDIPSYMISQALDNTLVLADSVKHLEISKASKRPKYDGDSEKTLLSWCEEGMKRIGKSGDKVYEDRLEYELSVLRTNDAINYFAIVGDICRWANDNGVRMGAGRGSAAGCLVSYLVGITQLDPIAHGLLFERFLNPDRKEAPDIDLDFASDKRGTVKAYAAEKYGEGHVADICSYQTFKPRITLQKISRVFDLDAFKITKSIDDLEKRPLEVLSKENELIGEYANKYPDAFLHACRLQGQVHTVSKHAGGVVITNEPLSDDMPTQVVGGKGDVRTQWAASADFNIISEYGWDKIDFLGITGLDTQEYACDLIEERTGERVKLNQLPILKDPYATDPKVLDIFNKGLLLGVFQFTGSPGWIKLAKEVQPTWFGDIAAMNALYRPGPLASKVDKSYAARKWGREQVTYPHESTEVVLKETYGFILYQEQIMDLVKVMANFTGGQSDNFRKAVSKEYRLGLEHVRKFLEDKGYKEQFWQGCNDNGIADDIADQVWKSILAFGDYGFNKSHACGYAAQSYQDAFLKAYYPTEAYASILTFDPDLAPRALRESRAFEVNIKPPDINKSKFGFTTDGESIRFGLKAVKNLGDKGVSQVLLERPFRSYEDFTERIPPRSCNSRARQSLVASGAFDSFGARKDWNAIDIAKGEKEALGISISESSAIKNYSKLIRSRISHNDVDSLEDEQSVIIGGEIIDIREVISRNGLMAFLTVEFEENTWNCTAFNEIYLAESDIIEVGKPVFIRGKKNTYRNRTSIVISAICHVEELALEISSDD